MPTLDPKHDPTPPDNPLPGELTDMGGCYTCGLSVPADLMCDIGQSSAPVWVCIPCYEEAAADDQDRRHA